MTAPHQCLCGLPGRDGRRGTSARGDASSPYPRGSPPPRPGRPRAGRHGLRRRERPSDGLAAGVDHLRYPEQRRGASRPVVADLGAAVARLPGVRSRPDRGVRPEPRGHVLALGPPVLGGGGSWASAAYRSDQAWRSSRLLENLATSRQLTSSDDPWEPLPEGASTRLLLERGEMRLTRHAPPYGRHSPRRPMTGLAGHLALRTAARTREGPRGRAHDRAAQGGHATRGGIRASTSRENTNGSSGICMGCCLGEDGKLAAALA